MSKRVTENLEDIHKQRFQILQVDSKKTINWKFKEKNNQIILWVKDDTDLPTLLK